MNKQLQKAIDSWVWSTWSKYHPRFFITLEWNDLPSDPITASSHSRHFKNVFLADYYKVSRASKIPAFPNRVGMTFFQEKSLYNKNGKTKLAYHTHIHMYNCDLENNNMSLWLEYPCLCEIYIQHHLGHRIKKLLKSTKTDNEGVVAKCWNADHHRCYNYKDFKRYKYHQDADWVVDYENSDLIAHQPRGKSK